MSVGDEAVVVLSWTEDGVTLQCHRRECMVGSGPWWWEDDLPFDCTPEQAVELANAHRATHEP